MWTASKTEILTYSKTSPSSLSNKPEPDADDSGFWEWLFEEDEKEYEKLRKEGKLIDVEEDPNGL